MTRRLLALLLVGVVTLAGFALAQEPAAKDEPPVRLKKKKPRGGDKPKVDPDKTDEKKDDKKAEKKDDKKAEPREAEPVTPQEEEKEVLQRVVKNVHNVGERLAKNDLGEATQQTQRDILKDLESLIQRNENPPPQADEDQDQGGGGDGQQDRNQQGGKAGRKSKGRSKGVGRKNGTRRQNQRQQAGRKQGSGDKPGGRNGKNGNGGGGGDKDDRARNKSADVYKAEWGHVPESLRAQMDAYSNPQSFIPKYDDLIKRYYRTIAEQGRRKGE